MPRRRARRNRSGRGSCEARSLVAPSLVTWPPVLSRLTLLSVARYHLTVESSLNVHRRSELEVVQRGMGRSAVRGCNVLDLHLSFLGTNSRVVTMRPSPPTIRL